METVFTIFIGLTGLALGSFLNVIIYRVPRKIGFVADRSVCPSCGRQLRWFHNIPLLSYLFLRGRCAFCRERISLRYPLVEGLNALMYTWFWIQLGPTAGFVGLAFLSSALLVIFFVDLDFQIIPDSITLPGMVLGLAVSFFDGQIGIVSSIIGLLVGGGALYLVAVLGDWLFKKESMGGGDIKMAAMLGAFLGWQQVLFVFMASAVIGLVVSLVIMAFSARLRETRMIPFGPFLAMAAMVSILYGERIVGLYVTHFLGRQ